MSDLELYKGLKNGDRNAVLEIYSRLLPRVKSWVTANNGTEADAHDLFQETLETILLKVDVIHSSFEGLVIKMSKNKWIDTLRKQKTIDKTKAYLEKSESLNEDEHLKMTEYHKYKLMEKYFSKLSNTCQQLMVLLKEGVSVQEVMKKLNFSSANTMYRRKAACIERWGQLVKKDVRYKELYS